MSAKRKGPREELLLRDFDTLRVLADAFRLRLFEVFKQKPVTAKQAAELLGEKLTRVYHHVEALADAGLIELVETQQKRGAVEKYYRAVARRVSVDPAMFRTGRVPAVEAGELSASLFVAALEVAAAETRKLARRTPEPGMEALLVHLLQDATKEEFAALRDELAAIASKAAKRSRGRTRYRLLLALYSTD